MFFDELASKTPHAQETSQRRKPKRLGRGESSNNIQEDWNSKNNSWCGAQLEKVMNNCVMQMNKLLLGSEVVEYNKKSLKIF